MHIRSLCLTRSFCWRTICSVTELWLIRRKRKSSTSPNPSNRAWPYRLARDLAGTRPLVTPAQLPRRAPRRLLPDARRWSGEHGSFGLPPQKKSAIGLRAILRLSIPSPLPLTSSATPTAAEAGNQSNNPFRLSRASCSGPSVLALPQWRRSLTYWRPWLTRWTCCCVWGVGSSWRNLVYVEDCVRLRDHRLRHAKFHRA